MIPRSYQLAVVNHGVIDSTCSNLQPGGEICLGTAGEDCSTTYVVKDNDTCDGINSAHGLNSTILYLNNPQINQACDNIYIGEVSIVTAFIFRHFLGFVCWLCCLCLPLCVSPSMFWINMEHDSLICFCNRFCALLSPFKFPRHPQVKFPPPISLSPRHPQSHPLSRLLLLLVSPHLPRLPLHLTRMTTTTMMSTTRISLSVMRSK